MGVDAVGARLRRRWLLVAMVLLLSVADSASSDSGNGETGQPRPPAVAINLPEHRTVVAVGSFEVSGTFAGQVDRIEIAIDGGPAIRAQPSDDAGRWQVPASRIDIAPGIHEIVATATGQAGTARDQIEVAYQPDGPGLAIRLAPERLRIDPTVPGGERGESRLESYATADSLRLDLAATTTPGGLDVELAPASVTGKTSAGVLVDATSAPPGDYVVTVTATDPDGAVRQAQLDVTVVGAPPPTTPTTTSAPATTTTTTTTTAAQHALRYDVLSTVTASSTGGVGNEAEATWEIAWPCDDGRCDGMVVDGGPRSRLAFAIAYEAATESYGFDVVLENAANEDCPTNPITGSIEPTAWDSAGPVTFDYTLDSVLQCTTGDLAVSWSGTGARSGP